MTDQYNALIVTLDKDIREDDAEVIMKAIKQIKHVVDVKGNVVDFGTYTVEARIKNELRTKVLNIFD